MAIIVRDQTATVEYSVGLNAKTMQDILDDWNRESQKTELEASSKTPAQPKLDPTTTKPNPDPETEDPIDAALLARFKKIAAEKIAERIEVTCDGRKIIPTAVELGPTPVHPFLLVVKFEFHLPVSRGIELKVDDRNFPDQTGAVRYALKAKGNSMLLKSDAAPILIRADRVELADMSSDERATCTKISAKLAVIGKSP